MLPATSRLNSMAARARLNARRHRFVGYLAISSSLFLLFFLMHTVTQAHYRKVEEEHKFKLQELASQLRAGDMRLVRPSPSDETIEQQKILCPSAIPSLVSSLENRKYLIQTRGVAVEVLQLCTTDNPENRQTIAENMEGKYEAFTNLIRDALDELDHTSSKSSGQEAILHAIGNAAEAIWILTFSNVRNHDGLLEVGAVDALSEVVMKCKSGRCSRAVMWSAAALQNLAASYCHSDSGRCKWKWDYKSDGTHEKLRLSSGTPLDVDAQNVRETIASNVNLLHKLVDITCSGPVSGSSEDLIIWPSKGQINSDDEYSTSIIPWASAGLFKNLALGGPEIRQVLQKDLDLVNCLCRMRKSPDWLEELKSKSAMYNLGVNFDDDKCYLGEAVNEEDEQVKD
mmetsp:Transcript_24122/g.33707  ORF Transcript_24122/g.33707 Transcript_24122/m.33707 type:complete len:399 (+) Transcript_24122:125-1321(+)